MPTVLYLSVLTVIVILSCTHHTPSPRSYSEAVMVAERSSFEAVAPFVKVTVAISLDVTSPSESAMFSAASEHTRTTARRPTATISFLTSLMLPP